MRLGTTADRRSGGAAGPGWWFRDHRVAARIDVARLDSFAAVRPVLRGRDGRLEMGPGNHHPGPAAPSARRSSQRDQTRRAMRG
jgi:hypothetical protein